MFNECAQSAEEKRRLLIIKFYSVITSQIFGSNVIFSWIIHDKLILKDYFRCIYYNTTERGYMVYYEVFDGTECNFEPACTSWWMI
ncbi:hypothetical protein BpHYR1_045635 [Brachionus plicatilis]|uniref:Uncharacterized protein n=1 Tax=Brachionus plicatilis TaxID=10195 RepID=A0A3M7QGH9_BRAPC|nr:hypothetical protein BpHYR1_045635 [Brachionus plicatilis]